MHLKVLCILLFVVLSYSHEHRSCPEVSLDPCICSESPFPYLVCENIDDPDTLVDVFKKSPSTFYSFVRITNSVLEYLPFDLFENVKITELHLRNVRLTQLFEQDPIHTESIRTLHLENTYTFKDFLWSQISSMTSLRILNIYFNRFEELGDEFVQYIPKDLQQLTFYDTKTAVIKTGAFSNLTSLEKLTVDHCKLRELRRDMFPVPFNVKFLHFNENFLTTLPVDLFTNMTQLYTISFRGNNIITLPFLSYDDDFTKIMYFNLEDNPINCDCKLRWIVKRPPSNLLGKCSRPPHMRGRNLTDFRESDMFCLRSENDHNMID